MGISAGRPFAVSNRCRHLFASLGKGHVTEGGCLECSWHGARYDVGLIFATAVLVVYNLWQARRRRRRP